MKYEEPQCLHIADSGRLFAGGQFADYRTRGERWRGRRPRRDCPIHSAMDADQGRSLRSRDLENVRAGAEECPGDLGRFDRRANLPSRKCHSVLQQGQRRKRSAALLTAITVLALVAVCANTAAAQTYGQSPANLLDQYRALRPSWFAAVTGAANRLFGVLALIEFAWSAAVLVLERTDLQGWTAGLIKRMMFVGAFYALLVNGPTWIPAIIDSFQIVGQNAAGLATGLSPGDIFLRGLDIAVTMASTSSVTGFLVNPAGAFVVVLSALIIFLSFVVVTIHFIMALVESYVVVGAGFIFLGFGGSRWTAPYVERYIALAVAVGVKIMVLYLLIGGGIAITSGWVARANTIGALLNPLMEVFDIVGGSVIFMALCWQAPKFTASLLGGSPAFSGGDIAAIGLAGAQTAFVVGSLGAGAAKLMAARGAAAGAMNVSQAAGMGAGGAGAAGSAGAPGGSGMPGGGNGGGRGSSGNSSGGNSSNGNGASGKPNGQPSPPSSKATPPISSGNPSSASSGNSPGAKTTNRPGPANNTPVPAHANDNASGQGALTRDPVSSAPNGGSQPSAPTSASRVAPPSVGVAANDSAFQVDQSPSAAVGAPVAARPRAETPTEPAGLAPPQSVSAPMTNSSPMDVMAPMSTGSEQPKPPTQQSTSMAAGTGNNAAEATLENPQTIGSPQTVNAPMTNSSPMTTASPMADQTVNRPANQVAPPGFVEKLENQLDRAAQRTGMLRQALPADGHAGSPAQLNLNGGE